LKPESLMELSRTEVYNYLQSKHTKRRWASQTKNQTKHVIHVDLGY